MMRGGRRAAGQRLGDVARQRLQEAQEHFTEGRDAEAVPLLERMAEVARERSMARVATHLSARAALCHARLGNPEAFTTWVEHAVADARRDGDPERSARTFGVLVAGLADTPLAESADQVTQSVREQVGVAPRAPSTNEVTVSRAMRRQLPQKCATCGALVRVEWVAFNEDGSVDCETCGGLVNG